VLLVEDDDFDQKNVARMLRDSEDQKFEVETVARLGAALERITAGKLDAVLLDVNLPDSSGELTVRAAVSRAVGIPIVVLTGGGDDDLGLESMRCGAQDYLPKDALEPALLRRVLTHAVERQRLLNDLSRRYAAWTTVVRSLRALDSADSLQKHHPARFQELVGVHTTLLERSSGALRAGEAHSATVEEIARRLVSNRATVSDLLDVHLAAIGRRVDAESQAGRTREQEQLLILELMGHLVTQYRAVAVETVQRPPRAL
ncbi:MAG: DNA-binding NarL/FixJ family response regulator, partial [Myxococcota bacterium]